MKRCKCGFVWSGSEPTCYNCKREWIDPSDSVVVAPDTAEKYLEHFKIKTVTEKPEGEFYEVPLITKKRGRPKGSKNRPKIDEHTN